MSTKQQTLTSAQSPVFSKGLGSAASTFLPRIFIFTCCWTWIVSSAWCYMTTDFYEIILSILLVTIAASPGKLGTSWDQHCIAVSSWSSTLPAFPAVKPYVAVVMLGCHYCLNSNALKVIRRGLGWLCGQISQSNCCLQFQRQRTKHICGYVVIAFSGKALPVLAPIPMPVLPVPWQEALPQSKGQQVTPLLLLTWQESSRPSPASSKEEAGSRYWYQLAAWTGLLQDKLCLT